MSTGLASADCVGIGPRLAAQVLDSNGSGGLTSQEFCAAMKKLVRVGKGGTCDWKGLGPQTPSD